MRRPRLQEDQEPPIPHVAHPAFEWQISTCLQTAAQAAADHALLLNVSTHTVTAESAVCLHVSR